MVPNQSDNVKLDILLSFFYSNEKDIDFAEQLESVAYVLCGEGPITFDKFISIWNAKGVSRLSNLTNDDLNSV